MELRILKLKASLLTVLWGVSLVGISMLRVPERDVRPDRGAIVTTQASIPKSGWLFGAGAVLSSVGLLSGLNVSDRENEWFAAIESLADDAVSAAFVPFKSDPAKKMASVVLKRLPAPLSSHLDRHDGGADLLDKFLRAPHNRLVGRTNAGKTYLLSALLIEWLRKNGPKGGVVTVCDRNFGKPVDRDSDTPSEAFDWLGLPVECIHYTNEAIEAALKAELEELERRIAIARQCAISKQPVPPFDPRLFILDELDSTQKDLNDGKGADGAFSKNLQRLLDQANGYRIKVVLCGQKLSVKESGINLATISSLATALLGTDTTNSKVVGYLDGADEGELADICCKLINARKRPAIVQIEGQAKPTAIAIPDLTEYRQTRIEYMPEVNPVGAQWSQIYTPQVEEKLYEIARALHEKTLKAPKGSGGPIKALVLPVLDLKPADLAKPIWKDYGAPAWNEIKLKVEKTL